MSTDSNPVVAGYSDLAEAYDAPGNLQSCWGLSSDEVLERIQIRDTYRTVADIGCGTGQALRALAARHPGAKFIGVEPAAQMRERAAERSRDLGNVELMEGRFEAIPLDDASVDFVYSIYAFHWVADPEAGAAELRRVLGDAGEMDLAFVGPGNGIEFNRVTTPIMRKYMGRAYMVKAARMQRQITKDDALSVFGAHFPAERLTAEESQRTYYDSLDGHWAWRPRIEGHFSEIPADKRSHFDQEVRKALQSLATDRGIPYTIHQLHVKVRQPRASPAS